MTISKLELCNLVHSKLNNLPDDNSRFTITKDKLVLEISSEIIDNGENYLKTYKLVNCSVAENNTKILEKRAIFRTTIGHSKYKLVLANWLYLSVGRDILLKLV